MSTFKTQEDVAYAEVNIRMRHEEASLEEVLELFLGKDTRRSLS